MATQINENAVKILREKISKRENFFIKCSSEKDLQIVLKIIELPTHFKDALGEYPIYFRIAQEKIKDVIPANEAEGLDVKAPLSHFSFGYFTDNETWRFCGIFEKRYDWNVKQWNEYLSAGTEKRFSECVCCGTLFKDDDILYQGFYVLPEGTMLKPVCKKCAYALSDKVTDYYLDESGEPVIQIWKKGEGNK